MLFKDPLRLCMVLLINVLCKFVNISKIVINSVPRLVRAVSYYLCSG